MNIGILLNHFGQSDIAYLTLAQLIALVKEDKNSYFGFYENLQPFCLPPPVALMNIGEIAGFNGIMITTTLDLTEKALGVISNNKVVFYVRDLDWMRGRNDYFQNIKTYQNPNVTIIAPSKDRAKELENYSNRKSDYIIPNFNLKEIVDVICRKT